MADEYKIREKVALLNIIDDILFHKMAEDKDFCEEMISTIMKQKIEVLQIIPQGSIKNLQGRSVIVDALCRTRDGKTCSIEIQRSDNHDHQRRVRYEASCITANITNPGTEFCHVPDLTVIYIAAFDMFKNRQVVYHVDRTIRESGKRVYNGLSEIYVNASEDDGSDIAELMKIFTQPETYNYEKFPHTSRRKAQFKNSEEGAEIMYDIVKDITEEARRREEEANKRTEEERKKAAEARKKTREAEKKLRQVIKSLVKVIEDSMSKYGVSLEEACKNAGRSVEEYYEDKAFLARK